MRIFIKNWNKSNLIILHITKSLLNLVNNIEYYEEFAKKHNLLITCGSDFHGKTKPSISLGHKGCKHPEEVETLLKKYELI